MSVLKTNHIYSGDSLKVLKSLPDKSIHMCVTSPPYWGLRDYRTAKWEGGDANCGHVGELVAVCPKCGASKIDMQIGNEPTVGEYIDNLCNIFDEVRRVLRDDGSCWVNIGDTYYGGNRAKSGSDVGRVDPKWKNKNKNDYAPNRIKQDGMLDKSLCLVPSRFAIEMVNRGWVLRSEIIWEKPNAMPSSAKDRFTVNFEKFFFFTKSPKYFFVTQYEEPKATLKLFSSTKERQIDLFDSKSTVGDKGDTVNLDAPLGRIKRSVWPITTKPYKGSHFATFPFDLIITPLRACCPRYVCKKCNFPREYIIKTEHIGSSTKRGGHDIGDNIYKIPNEIAKSKILGLTECKCNAGFHGGIVIDPFMGAGTTALVALKMGLRYVGIELNEEYIKNAKDRIENVEEDELFWGDQL